jgi:23S rRNA (adenine-N6)-dimethyltransferase
MAKRERSTLWRTQNFLRAAAVIKATLERSGIGPSDVVLDIGAGTGAVSKLLRAQGARVIAVERDPTLCGRLRRAFREDAAAVVVCDDFLRVPLPSRSYKVFANPPFDITTAIVSRLMNAPNAPDDAFLVVQREAADRYMGRPFETLYALLLKPWFASSVVHQFRREDFVPAPNVDVVMLRLRKRGPPLVATSKRALYRDFVVACFTAWRPSITAALDRALGARAALELLRQADVGGGAKPSEVPFIGWLELFAAFARMPDEVTQRVVGAEQRLRAQQKRLRKIHRTRVPRDDLSVRSHATDASPAPAARTGRNRASVL